MFSHDAHVVSSLQGTTLTAEKHDNATKSPSRLMWRTTTVC